MEDRQNGRPSQEHIHHCLLKLKNEKNLHQMFSRKNEIPNFKIGIFSLTNQSVLSEKIANKQSSELLNRCFHEKTKLQIFKNDSL